MCCRTPRARRSRPTPSRPASTTPGWARSTPGSRTPAARTTGPSPTPRRWRRSRCCAGPRGSSRRWSRRTRSPGPFRPGRNWATARCCSSTCPGAVTRTSPRPPGGLVTWPVNPRGRPGPARERGGGRLRQGRGRRPGVLVGYLPAGFPTVHGAIAATLAMAESGADIVEIGLPYSDPLIDGPVIQQAVHRALTGGVHVRDVLRTVEAVAAAGIPALVMTYWNPVEHYGVDAFARDLAAAGGSGMITPDLPPEEAGPWL